MKKTCQKKLQLKRETILRLAVPSGRCSKHTRSNYGCAKDP